MEKRVIRSLKQGKRLKEARELTLLTRRAFARKYKFNNSSLQAWEDGRHKNGIHFNNAADIVTALLNENIECSIEWLLDGKGEPPRRHTSLLQSTFKGYTSDIIEESRKYKKIREKNLLLIKHIQQGNLLKAQQIISEGANLHTLNSDELYLYSREENTALHLAAQYENVLLVELMLSMGINPNIRNRYKDTPLHIAAYENNTRVIKTLANAGGNIEASNNEGSTPLMWASINGRLPACELLISLGANINNTDYLGNTAMHWAAFDGQSKTIHELYKKGARIDIINHKQKTPLDIAIKNGQTRAVEMILKLGNKDAHG